MKNSFDSLVGTDQDLNSVVSESTLVSMLSDIVNDLKYPVTIVDIGSKYENTSGPDGSYSSPFRFVHARTCCSAFRKYAKDSWCKQVDRKYASLFRNLNTSNYKSILKSIAEDFYETVGYFRLNKPEYDEIDGNGYIHYICPFLGYREVIIPIFIEGVTIGAFFVGQIRLEGMSNLEKSYKCSTAASSIFDEYICKLKGTDKYLKDCKKEIVNEIIEEPNNIISSLPDLFSEDSFKQDKIPEIWDYAFYEEILRKAIKGVRSLENKLTSKIKYKRQKAIQNLFYSIKDCLLLKYYNMSEGSIKKFWDLVGESFNEMLPALRNYGLLEIKCFSSNKLNFENGTKLDLQYDSDIRKTQTIIDFDLIKTGCDINRPINSMEMPSICDSVVCEENIGDNVVTIFPSKDNLSHSIAFVFIYNRSDYSYDYLHCIKQIIADNFCTILGQLLFALYSSFTTGIALNQAKKALLIYKHEVSNYIVNLSSCYDILSNTKSIYTRPANERKKIRELEYVRSQMESLGDYAGIIGGMKRKQEKKRFQAYEEVLLKWRTINFVDDNKKINVIVPYKNDQLRPPIYFDKMYFNEICNNLIDNAIKYSHTGTNIYVDFAKKTPESSIMTLRVLDYGIRFEEEFSPFYIFQRGKDASRIASGSGIGLYLIKEICNDTDAHCRYTCRKISDYYIPYLDAYEKLQPDEAQKMKEELFISNYGKGNFFSQSRYEKIVNPAFTYISQSASDDEEIILNSIKSPTYEVQFFVDFYNIDK